MRQTNQYKLNLIEQGDTFSPDPLNENMEKVEAVLTDGLKAEAAVRANTDAVLDQRLTALEAKKVVFGSYSPTTNQAKVTVDLGFTPIAVFIMPSDVHQSCSAFCIGDRPVIYNRLESSVQVSIVENGFTTAGFMCNYVYTYNYVAFG